MYLLNASQNGGGSSKKLQLKDTWNYSQSRTKSDHVCVEASIQVAPAIKELTQQQIL